MKRYFSLSFLLHATVICAVFLPIYFYHQQIGNTQTIRINFQTNAFLFEKHKTADEKQKGTSQTKQLKQDNNLSNQNISGRESKLLFYLHDVIQKNLLSLNTKANLNVLLNATLAFTVLPNGKIKQAHLIKSTHNPQIDRNILKSVTLINTVPAAIRPNKPLNLGIDVYSVFGVRQDETLKNSLKSRGYKISFI